MRLRRPLHHATVGSPQSITRTEDDKEGCCCRAPSYVDAVTAHRRKTIAGVASPCYCFAESTAFDDRCVAGGPSKPNCRRGGCRPRPGRCSASEVHCHVCFDEQGRVREGWGSFSRNRSGRSCVDPPWLSSGCSPLHGHLGRLRGNRHTPPLEQGRGAWCCRRSPPDSSVAAATLRRKEDAVVVLFRASSAGLHKRTRAKSSLRPVTAYRRGSFRHLLPLKQREGKTPAAANLARRTSPLLRIAVTSSPKGVGKLTPGGGSFPKECLKAVTKRKLIETPKEDNGWGVTYRSIASPEGKAKRSEARGKRSFPCVKPSALEKTTASPRRLRGKS
nr:hypothetical protein Iba_scaffold10328CG0190 [Ipomoea batatas]